jgi:hypothetical protein
VPVRQPYAGVDFIPQSGFYEFGYWICIHSFTKYCYKNLCGSESLQGKYSNSISAAAGFYPSSGYNDEIVWAAAWVAKATGAAADVTRAVSLYNNLGNRNKYRYF